MEEQSKELEGAKVQKTVWLTPLIIQKLEQASKDRDRTAHYILIEIIETNIDNHAKEPSLKA